MGRQPVEELQTGGKSVWDIKVHPETRDWGIACVYDGYLFDINRGKNKPNEDHSLNSLNFSANYTGHTSICYSFAWTEKSIDEQPVMLTSSFYDNTVRTLKINNA